jgi:uncharacterized protein YndB with AHSA1/START domain
MRRLIAALVFLVASSAHAQQIDMTVTAQADGSRTLAHEVTVPAAIDDVWAAVATVDGWRTWAVPVARPVPGAPDRFETAYGPDPASAIEQQWIERTAPRRAVFRTTRTPRGFPHADVYGGVINRFTLTPVGAGETRVRLEASGYPAGAAGDTLLGFFREGNRTSLQQLHKRFVTGPIQWPAPAPQGEK